MDTATPTKRDSKLVADEYDRAVLEALHRFGWLPTRDLSTLIWPRHQGTSCAKRSLARLRRAGYIAQTATQVTRGRGGAVIADRAPDGAVISVLTEAGAAFLRANRELPAVPGEHLLPGFAATYRHRCLSNQFVIDWLKKNAETSGTICTEYEIATRRSVLNRKDGCDGDKIADAFIVQDAPNSWLAARRREAEKMGWKFVPQRWATWIEVENAYKKAPEQKKMGRELCRLVGGDVLYPTNQDGVVIGAVLVLCPDEPTERRLVLTILEAAHGVESDHLNSSDILGRVRVWRKGGEEHRIWDYIKADPELDALRFKLGGEQIARKEKKRR